MHSTGLGLALGSGSWSALYWESLLAWVPPNSSCHRLPDWADVVLRQYTCERAQGFLLVGVWEVYDMPGKLEHRMRQQMVSHACALPSPLKKYLI